jgi:hypothetical protein
MALSELANPAPGRAELLTFVTVFLSLLLWIPSLTDRLDPLTGDEPFYVMTALSILHDRDLDERNNYDARDFDTFYPAFGPPRDGWPSFPDPLPPHATASQLPGLYSKHGLGLALLIALPWELGGRTLTLAVLAFIAALVALNMTLLARQFGASQPVAVLTALLLACSNPLLSFSLLIFPEMTAALCIVYASRRLIASRNMTWQWAAIGCCASALPWMHYRLAPVSVVIAIVAIARFRQQNALRDWIAASIAPLVSGATLLAWFVRLYGSPLPPNSDHAGFSEPLGVLNGAMGTLFDQQWGAFVHNPLLILATAAALPFACRYRVAALCLAAVILPYLGLVSAYRVWWGEWNPPARYLTDIVPLAAAPLGWLLTSWRLRTRLFVTVAAGALAAAVMLTFLDDPQRMYNHPDGSSQLLETWSQWLGLDLTTTVPSLVSYSRSPLSDRVMFSGMGLASFALLASILYVITKMRHAPPEIGERSAILPLP